MQSLDALRDLAALDRDLLERRAREFVIAHSSFDFDRVAGLLGPAAAITVVGDAALHPYAGHYVGHDAIAELLRRKRSLFETLDQQILDVVVDHDRAVVRLRLTLRQLGTRQVRQLDICSWIRFEAGLLREVVLYSDTALSASLAGG